jgi:hypothetical protein
MGYEGNLGGLDLSGAAASYKEILSDTGALRETGTDNPVVLDCPVVTGLRPLGGCAAGFGARVDGK